METDINYSETKLKYCPSTLMQIKVLFLCLAYEKPYSQAPYLIDLPHPEATKLIAALHLVATEVAEFMSFDGEGDKVHELYKTLLDTHIKTEKVK